MKLNQLLNHFFDMDKEEYQETNVSGICTDTREVSDGDLFILQKGERFDSHDVYKELENKVSAFISEKEIDTNIPCFVVADANDIIGPVAATFYGNPTNDMINIAVTGTNGKTSVTSILSHIFQSHHKNVGLIGTNGIFVNDEPIIDNVKTPTTPPPLELQKIAYQIKRHEADYNIMEVTSHGLHFNRTKAIDYKYRLFTNLTVDHLDFHGTMENYFHTKSKLFIDAKQDEYCILNKDSSYFNELNKLSLGKVVFYEV